MNKIFFVTILSFVLISTVYPEDWQAPYYSEEWEQSLNDGNFQSLSTGYIESGNTGGMLLVVSDETSSSVHLFISISSYMSLKNKNQVGIHGETMRGRGQPIQYYQILDVKWIAFDEDYMATILYYDDSEDITINADEEMRSFLSSDMINIIFNPKKEPHNYHGYVVTGVDELSFSGRSAIFGYGFTVDLHIHPLVQMIRDYEEREYWWGVLMMD